MTKEEDTLFGAKIVGIASGVRRVVLHGNQRITEAVEASPYDDHELEPLIEFADMLMDGYDKEYIVDRLQMAPEFVERLDKLGIYDW